MKSDDDHERRDEAGLQSAAGGEADPDREQHDCPSQNDDDEDTITESQHQSDNAGNSTRPEHACSPCTPLVPARLTGCPTALVPVPDRANVEML
jgi:hypothetical protein